MKPLLLLLLSYAVPASVLKSDAFTGATDYDGGVGGYDGRGADGTALFPGFSLMAPVWFVVGSFLSPSVGLGFHQQSHWSSDRHNRTQPCQWHTHIASEDPQGNGKKQRGGGGGVEEKGRGRGRERRGGAQGGEG